jgi:hypothetical protein
MSIHIITHLDKDRSPILAFFENVKVSLICDFDSEGVLRNPDEVSEFQLQIASKSNDLLALVKLLFTFKEKITRDLKSFVSLMTIIAAEIAEIEDNKNKNALLSEYWEFYRSLDDFGLKAKMLSCLFNATADNDPYQYEILLEIIALTDKFRKIGIILNTIERIDDYLVRWKLFNNIEKKREIYKTILLALVNNNKEKVGLDLFIKYLKTYEDETEEKIRKAEDSEFIKQLLNKFLQMESFQDELFEEVHILKRLSYIDDGKLKEILSLLVTGDLTLFKNWIPSNKNYLENDLKINVEKIQEKIRIKCLATFDETAKTISFKEIAEKLQVNEDEVEDWVILGIQNKIIIAKIDEFNKTVEILDNSSKYLVEKDWKNLDENLERFIKVLEGYRAAKKEK